MNVIAREAFEPQSWLLVFNHEASTRWRSFLAFGRFKHVWALAWVPAHKSWLVYDVHLDGTTIGLVPEGKPFEEFLGRQTQGMRKATLVRMPRRPPETRPKPARNYNIGHRLGFWCVPAIKHLIGVRCGALRPDALYRACLRHGGTVFEIGSTGSATDEPSAVPAVAA